MERRKTDRRFNMAIDQYVIDVRDLAKQVWRRRALVAILIAVPTILGFFYVISRPDIYRSTATVVIEDNSLKMADVEDAVPGMEFDNLTVDTQATMIRSPGIMRQVIETLGLRLDGSGRLVSSSLTNKNDKTVAEPAKETDESKDDIKNNYGVLTSYAKGLTVLPIKGSRIIEISFQSQNPYLSTEIANAHAQGYLDSQILLKKEQSQQLNNWISEQVEILKKQTTEKSTAVQEFRQKNNMIKGGDSEDLIYQQVSDIAAELVPLEAKKADLQAQYDAITAGDKTATMASIQNSSVIQSLKTQSSSAKQDLRALSSKYGENHPLYVEAQRRVSQIEGDIARETKMIKDAVKTDLDTLIAQEVLLNDRLSSIKGEADTQRKKQIELESLELEAAASAKLLDSFIARYEEISSQLDFARPDVRIISKAEIPMQSLGNKGALKMIVIVFLSSVFACLVVFLLTLADRGIQSVEEVKKLLQFRMLGVLPDVRNPVAEIISGNRSTYLEEIKRIYLHISNKPSVKTILITAASTGEGKTSMVLALASYLVSTGRKTIVIDADIRTPDVARLAGIDEAPGLAEVLAGKANLETVIRRDERGLSLIVAGDSSALKANILTSNGFRAVMDSLKDSYDYILIDSAPVLDSSDAETVASIVDQVVMVVAYSTTSKRDLKKAADTLRQFATDVPSVILNKADLKNVA